MLKLNLLFKRNLGINYAIPKLHGGIMQTENCLGHYHVNYEHTSSPNFSRKTCQAAAVF